MEPHQNIHGASREPGDPPPPAEERIDEIADQFLADCRKGNGPDRRRIAELNPELSPWLERRLLLVEKMLRAGQPSSVSLRVRCPHCGHPSHLPRDSRLSHAVCASCGSSFKVEAGLASPAPAAMPERIGRFQVVQLVGRGSFGSVYKAVDPDLNRVVAVKVPRAGWFTGTEDEERFLREARSAARLRHPSIVEVHEIGYQDGVPHIVSGFIDGRTLADRIARDRPGFREAAQILARTAEALEHAHREGIVHRDVKPQNVLLDSEGEPHVTDFGLARADEGEVTVTLDGQILGTPAYMSPEQAAGDHRRVDARSDVYSLGVVLYEALTGERPFNGSKSMVIHQVLHDEPRAPRKLNDHIPRDLETICLKAMAKDPARRFAAAGKLAEDLRRYLRGETILSRPAGTGERLLRWCRRRPAVASLLLTVALLLVTVAVVASAMAVRTARARDAANQRLSRLNVVAGLRSVAEGEPLDALPWLADAWGLERGRPDREETHRLRFEVTLRRCPKLTEVWFLEGTNGLLFSPDAKRMALWGGGGCRIIDLGDIAGSARALGHPGKVRRAAFDPSGLRLATGGEEGKVMVWEASTGSPVAGPLVHRDAVNGLGFSPDGRFLVTASTDRTARVFEAATGAATGPVLEDRHRVNHACFSPDGRRILTTTEGGTAQVWDRDTGQPVGAAVQHSGPIRKAAFSPDGTRVVTASVDGSARLFSSESGAPVSEPLWHWNPVHDASFSPDGRRVVTASLNGSAWVWDADTGLLALPPFPHRLGVLVASYSADGRWVMSGGMEGEVRVRDAASGEPVLPLIHHGTKLNGASISPDRRWLATSGAEGTVRLWDLAGGDPLLPLALPGGPATLMTVSPRGDRMALVGSGRTVEVWDAATLDLLHRRAVNASTITSLQFSPDGSRLVASGADGLVKVLDVERGMAVGRPLVHPARVAQARFRPDGRALATVCDDGRARIFDLATGEEAGPQLSHQGRLFSCAFSPDGDELVTTGADGTARIWELKRGSLLHPPLRHAAAVHLAVYSPDGRWILTVTESWTARIFSARTGEPSTPDLPHDSEVLHVEFDPQSNRVVIADREGIARVWDAASGEPVSPELRHSASVFWASFSPDGRRVVTASWNRSAVVWDVATGEEITPRLEHSSPALFAAFRRDGGGVLTVEQTGTPRRWSLPKESRPLEEALVLARAASSGHGIDATGGLVRLTQEEFRADWEALRARNPQALAISPDELLGWHRREAADCERTRAWSAALPHLDILLEKYPASAAVLRFRRGRALASLGRFAEGAAELARSRKLDPSRELAWNEEELARVGMGDLQGAREVCEEWARAFETTDDPDHLHLLAWGCALLPRGLEDPERVVRMARRAVSLLPREPGVRNTLGAALYRAGRAKEAIAELEEASRLKGAAESAWDWVFLALSHGALGHLEEGRKWLDRTRRWWEQVESGRRDLELRPTASRWRLQMEMESFLKEAEAALAR